MNDLTADVMPYLNSLTGIVEVQRFGPDSAPTHRIIHICDEPGMPRSEFAASLADGEEVELSEEELDRRYRRYVKRVRSLQQHQGYFISALLKRGGAKRIHVGNFPVGADEELNERIDEAQKNEVEIDVLRSKTMELVTAKAPPNEVVEAEHKVSLQAGDHHIDLMLLGVAPQLKSYGDIDQVIPVGVDDEAAPDERAEAIVQKLLEDGPVTYVVLDKAFDLAIAVDRLSEGKAEYIRVEVDAIAPPE